jgi:hypothetical protein
MGVPSKSPLYDSIISRNAGRGFNGRSSHTVARGEGLPEYNMTMILINIPTAVIFSLRRWSFNLLFKLMYMYGT